MRIALLPDYYLPHIGGMELWTQKIAEQLVKRGHDVTVYAYKTSSCRNSESRNGLTIKRVGPFWVDRTHSYVLRGASLGVGLPPHLLAEKYDVYLPTYSPLLLCKMLKRGPVVPIWHGYYGLSYSRHAKGAVKGLARYLVERTALAQRVDALIAVSNQLREVLMKMNQELDSEEVHVVYGGVDLNEIDSVDNVESKEQICFIGRFEYDKCPHHVVEAFKMINKDFPQLRLVMVGGGSMLQNVKEMVGQQPQLRDRVEFTGYLFGDEKIRIMKESLLLVRPSIMDAWPLTTLEALACKTPFVAYDIPPIREQNEYAEGGLIVDEGDVKGLADAVKVLIKEPGLAQKMGMMGRKSTEETFTWERSVEKLEKVLNDVQ